VPILQVGVGGDGLSEQQLYDMGQNFIRTRLATVQGAQIPLPLGGKPRQVMVDLDPQALYANNLSPSDISLAINAQNLILPAGNAKIGPRDYQVQLNSSPDVLEALNDLPIRHVGGATIHIRDVAQVRDGAAVQSNIVVKDGQRGSLLTILKAGGASTLDIVARVKAAMPLIKASLPDELKIDFLFDQSVFVRHSIEGVLHEAAIAAVLTGLMILLFLGSWRSTLIVTISIPLSIMISILILSALGHTINCRWRSGSWWTTPPSRSRTSTATWRWGSR
jgi:multidrug efflux pump subunit AcrB